MAEAYACQDCGVLTTNPDHCNGCGGYDVASVDLGSGDDVYECHCGDSFDSERGLQTHQRVHDGE